MAAAFLSLAEFRVRFPEFDPVSDALVQARLDEAAAETPLAVFGGSTSAAHGWLAADLLSHSGYGREASRDGTTSYGRRRLALDRDFGLRATPRST